MISLLDYRSAKNSLRTLGKNISIEDTRSEEFRNNIEKMKEILALDGVGLAATQVNWPVQLFMLCIDEHHAKLTEPEIFINPKIEMFSKEQIKLEEGCLSFPKLFIPINRPESVKWSYQTLEGETLFKESSGFYARAIQHEIDHCNGRLFIDRASSVAKLKINRWLKSSN